MDVLDFLVLLLVTGNVVLAPYSKVEESFNTQAVHDLLLYGPLKLEKYDHFEFPGVVPRTFVGSCLLAAASYPMAIIHRMFDPTMEEKLVLQLLVRTVLGLYVANCLARLRHAARKVFGPSAANVMGVLQCCQFHGLFWSSRTLPNIFAYGIVVLGFASWISSIEGPLRNPSKPKPKTEREFLRSLNRDLQVRIRQSGHLSTCLRFITAAGVIFRSELVALLGPLTIVECVLGRLKIIDVLRICVPAAVLSLVATVAVDSYFWQTPFTWPEGEAFYFNAVLGRSSEWGTSPFHTYFFVHLPRLLTVAYPLAVYAYLKEARVRRFLLPCIAFVGVMSFLGHKEWRFIMYVVPIFNIAAGVGWIILKRNALFSTAARCGYACARYLLVISFISSIAMSYISSLNYPGGVALRMVHRLEKGAKDVYLHIDTYTAMTGASRFGQVYLDRGWRYSKNETHRHPSEYTSYTRLLTSTPRIHEPLFRSMEVVPGFDRISVYPLPVYAARVEDCLRRPAACVLPVEDDNDARKGGGQLAPLGRLLAIPARLLVRFLPVRVVMKPKVWIMRRSEPKDEK